MLFPISNKNMDRTALATSVVYTAPSSGRVRKLAILIRWKDLFLVPTFTLQRTKKISRKYFFWTYTAELIDILKKTSEHSFLAKTFAVYEISLLNMHFNFAGWRPLRPWLALDCNLHWKVLVKNNTYWATKIIKSSWKIFLFKEEFRAIIIFENLNNSRRRLF